MIYLGDKYIILDIIKILSLPCQAVLSVNIVTYHFGGLYHIASCGVLRMDSFEGCEHSILEIKSFLFRTLQDWSLAFIVFLASLF